MKTKIEIPLRVASKKNNRRNFGRISLPSKAYENFHSLAGEYLMPFSYLNITKPFRIDISYYIKGNYHQDIDNAVSSVLDCLKDYNIIQDDDLCVEITAKKYRNNYKNWNCVIEIEELPLAI